MKRRPFTILFGMVFFLLLSTLGRPVSAQAGKTEVILWHSYRGDERKALEEVARVFNASNATIKLSLLAVPHDAFPDKISAAIPAGKGPDIFIFAHDRIGDWAENGVLEPVDFWVDESLRKKFMPQTLKPLEYRRSLYALPMAFKSTALFYNKALIKEPPTTTDELIALAKKFTDKTKKLYGLVYENTNFYHHSAWLHGFGGAVFDSSGKLVLGSSEAAASFAFARDLRNKEQIVPEEITSVLVTSLFNEGKAAMVINGPWFRGELSEKLDYGVAPLPVISATGLPARPFMSSEGVMLNARSKHKEDAFDVMVFLTGDRAAAIRMEIGKQTVANVAAYERVADPIIEVFRRQLDQTVPMPNTPQMLMVWSPATTALNKVVSGGADPVKALRQAQSEIQDAIHSSRR